jgi:hypothetical protein
MKYQIIIALILYTCLNGCKQSTSPTYGQSILGIWQEEFTWHSPFPNVIAEDTTMIKKSIITFYEKSFTLKITPPHRMFVTIDSTKYIVNSDTVYNGTFDIIGDTLRLFYDIDIYHHSVYLRYYFQNDNLHLEQVPIIILGRPAYILTNIPWASSSNKHSGVFLRLL